MIQFFTLNGVVLLLGDVVSLKENFYEVSFFAAAYNLLKKSWWIEHNNPNHGSVSFDRKEK